MRSNKYLQNLAVEIDQRMVNLFFDVVVASPRS